AMIVMLIALYPLKPSVIAVFSIVLVVQFLFILVLQLFVAILSFKLHRPVKIFMTLLANSRLNQNIHLKLKVSRHIELFHSNFRYIFTYGRYGNITLATISRV